MPPKLPPPDPHESFDTGFDDGRLMPGPTAVFVKGPPSPEVDRVADAILELRPGALIVLTD